MSLLTAKEYMLVPDPRNLRAFELVRGEVVYRPYEGGIHGETKGNLLAVVLTFVRKMQLGSVASCGLITRRNPDTVRWPDLAFWRDGETPRPELLGDDYPEIVPELVAEVLSPTIPEPEMPEKVDEYFAMGVPMVWLLDPMNETVTVRRPGSSFTLASDARLDGEDVLPGFSITVAELFE